MKVKAPNGREYKLMLSGHVAKNDLSDDKTRSAGHKIARALLFTLYPFDMIYEEVFLPGAKWPLYLDLFLPAVKLAVEVQGRQHRQFVPFLHGTKEKFRAQRQRDFTKFKYLFDNGVRLVCLDDDKPGEWRDAIMGKSVEESGPMGR